MLMGISKFAQTKPFWALHLVQSDSPVLQQDIRQWNPDGIISGIVDADIISMQGCDYKKPWVAVLMQPDDSSIPFVTVDEDAISRMAADYFLSRKFTNFAFIGNDMHEFSVQRAEAFLYAVEESGHECSVHLYPTKVHNIDKKTCAAIDREKLKWLKSLPKPVAVFACNDWEAFQFIQFCRQYDFRVPEDVAILGVGNDEMLCNISNPPLSSIRMPFERVGYNAAELLEKVLNGCNIPQNKNFLPPIGLVSRQSTDVLQVLDPAVSKALQFMQEHISEPIKVDDILDHVFISRTLLERKFRHELGRTPLVEIRRQRILRVKQLLSDTTMSMAEIAEACGFSSDVRLSTVFKELTGQAPSAYRTEIKTP